MSYLVTIYEDGDEQQFAISSDAEITPLFDIEADEAAFELGFQPSSALIYYLAFDWSPFDTILALLDAEETMLFMVSCIESVWPLVEDCFSDTDKDLVMAEQAILLAKQIVAGDEEVAWPIDWLALKDFFDKRVSKTAQKGRVSVTYIRTSTFPTARKALLVAFANLLNAITAFHKIREEAPVPLAGGVGGLRKKAYQVALRCRQAVNASGGDPEQEEDWQVLEVFRLALRGEPERHFAYEVAYQSKAGEYYDVPVVGTLEPD
jgi:hypothetical protein